MVLYTQYWFCRHAEYKSDEGHIGFHPDFKVRLGLLQEDPGKAVCETVRKSKLQWIPGC